MFRTLAEKVSLTRNFLRKGTDLMADENEDETTQDDTNTTDHSPEAAQVGTSDGDGDSEKSE
jgi:hypothetical protein